MKIYNVMVEYDGNIQQSDLLKEVMKDILNGDLPGSKKHKLNVVDIEEINSPWEMD